MSLNTKIIFGLLVMILMFTNVALAASVEISDERATAEYWTKRNPDGDKILIDAQSIAQLNNQIRTRDAYSVDLSKYPETISADTVKSKITQLTDDIQLTNVDDLYFSNGAAVPHAGFQKTMTNRNLDALTGQLKVRYAVTTERTNLKLVPENTGWYPKPIEYHLDEIQGTAIDPAEALAVLYDSLDGKMIFVQTRNYFGWVDKSKVTFTDRKTWLTYVNPAEFLVVTNNKKFVTVNDKMILFQMGAKIPLKNATVTDNAWTARIPVDSGGTLTEVDVNIPNDIHVNKGFIPCTNNNFIRQAFKFLGNVYGWGGLDNSVDCSAFVNDIYRTMGIEIPRDADRQEKSLTRLTVFNDMTHDARITAVKRSPSGALLFKPGHVMMHLGADDKGTPLIIHALSSYYDGTQKVFLRKVIVSDLSYKNASGVATIDGLTSVNFVR